MPLPNKALTPQELNTYFGTLGVDPEAAVPLVAAYTSAERNLYRLGFSALLMDLAAQPPDSAVRLSIVGQLQLLGDKDLSYPFGWENRQFYELLSDPFTTDQRIMICCRIIDLHGILSKAQVKEALNHAIYFGDYYLCHQEKKPEKFSAVINQRLMNLYNCLNTLNASTLVTQLKDPLLQYELILTGSDSHMRGRQVVILKDSTGERVVLKPHNMNMERGLANAISGLNTLLFPEQSGYHIRSVAVMKSPANGDWGAEEFLVRKGSRTAAEARDYYRRMGVLTCYAKLLGLTDAHQDNVFSTADGPVISDAECAFDPWVMRSEHLFSTAIGMAFQQPLGDGGEANAFFLIDGKNCTDEFGCYTAEILDGYRKAAGACAGNAAGVASLVAAVMTGVPKIRWVPLATRSFWQLSRDYYQDEAAMRTRDTYRALEHSVAHMRISMPRKDWDALLNDTVARSFDEGDVPYFTLNLPASGGSKGIITCDDTPVAAAPYLYQQPVEQTVAQNVSFLASKAAETQLQDFLEGR